jgi:hypothetical protein
MDKQKLHTDLTRFHILALYDFMCLINYECFTAETINIRQKIALDRYRNDTIFHSRVDFLVTSTMRIFKENRY